jgi:hypothetical protein
MIPGNLKLIDDFLYVYTAVNSLMTMEVEARKDEKQKDKVERSQQKGNVLRLKFSVLNEIQRWKDKTILKLY